MGRDRHGIDVGGEAVQNGGASTSDPAQSTAAAMVQIHYCRLCGFAEHAEAIAAALEIELGLASELREAFWGTFRIEWSGREIYNRWRTRGILGRLGMGRTPTPDEIVSLFAEVSDRAPQTPQQTPLAQSGSAGT